jgi:hypothetical protein
MGDAACIGSEIIVKSLVELEARNMLFPELLADGSADALAWAFESLDLPLPPTFEIKDLSAMKRSA